MRKKILLIAGLSTVIFLSACGTKTMEINHKETTASSEDGVFKKEAVFIEAIKENLNFEIELNQQSFDLDDEIIIRATATNIGSSNFVYVSGSSSCPSHLSIKVISQQTGHQLMIKPTNESRECTDDLNVSELPPQESVMKEAIFLPKELIGTSSVPANGGTYDVIVTIQPGDDLRLQSHKPIEIKTEISIIGNAQTTISKEAAEEIANHHDEVKKWIENHSGESISKFENGAYYILWYDGWQKTAKEEFDRLKDGIYQEEKQVRFENNQWSIEYLSKIGTAPHRIKVFVDAYSGEIVSIEYMER